jgi:hypothetical protein
METFSLVAKINFLLFILSLVASFGWEVHIYMDVKGEFI